MLRPRNMKNRPVIVGISCLQQKGDFEDLDEALILMDKATKSAINDSTNKNIVNYINEVRVPKGFWRYRDPGKWVAESNNINSAETYVTKIGILQQNLINSACNKIINGEINGSLILGGESRYKMIRASIENEEYVETPLDINPDNYIKAPDDLQLDIEEKELGLMAVGYYAILESAFRAASNSEINEHNDFLASIYAHFSKIASKNNDGWIGKSLKKSEILNKSKKNPPQAFPYNKYHCTSWNVNQSAAIIICSEAVADKLSVPNEKRVYPLASSENNHMIATLQRPNLIEPIGMRLASEYILKICEKNNLNIDFYDLYSCFPIAIQMFAKSLQLKDINNSSITGAMPFAGGPINSFVLHSTVKLISKIRKQQKGTGIVTGVSGMMTKQSYALWSKNPVIDFIYKDFTNEANSIETPIELSNEVNGDGVIIGYTVLKKNISKAVIYLNTADNKRKLITSSDKSIIESMENEEWVGKKVNFKKNQLVL
jgi:acetyl-CoA C-acetyltransferase